VTPDALAERDKRDMVPMNNRLSAAVEAIEKQLAELEEICQQAHSDLAVSGESIKRWKERTARLLERHLCATDAQALRRTRLTSFMFNNPIGNFMRGADKYRAFLHSLRDEVVQHPEDVLSRVADEGGESDGAASPAPVSKVVFIIHGHDETNLYRLKDLLKDEWDLESIILQVKPGQGRTLIEKFEQEAAGAGFAFALLTPDDTIEKADGEYAQARPNVAFELGWFYGRMGRENVAILLRKGTKIHSDLHGICRIEFTEDVTEKTLAIRDELRAAGIVP